MSKLKTNAKNPTELEQFRSELAGKVILTEAYQFKFFKTHSEMGGFEIKDLQSNKKINSNYALKMLNGKCSVSFDLRCKPFDYPGFHWVEFSDYEAFLKTL